jgi:hypothetical protein
MRSSLNTYRKEEVIRAVSNDLVDTQREKLKKLSEGVEYTTRKEFAEKLKSLKESYFPKKTTAVRREEQPLVESVQKPAANSEMSVYSQMISKMKKNS